MEPQERVILKSVELFTQSGIRLVTMDQIAEELGMSKRTIYELFRDKDTLVSECLEKMHREHLEEIQAILDRATNVIEALYLVGQHGERKKAQTNRLFFEDIRKYYPETWNMIKQRSRPGSNTFSYKIIKQGIEEGIFRSDLNTVVVDSFIHIMMDAIHNNEAFPQDTSPRDLLINIIIPYYIGISTEKGRMLIEQYAQLTLS